MGARKKKRKAKKKKDRTSFEPAERWKWKILLPSKGRDIKMKIVMIIKNPKY